ncbi:hypothetical protein HMI55_003828 [Coelomomyces lativittatus]|nr:hypothetical protein HMI55_003828 [Coelomomyces lativittatus]
MASDGVWDGLSEQELKQVVQQAWLTQNKEVSVFAQQCAEAVVQAALMGLDAKSLDDNITAICILIPAENQSVHATNI